MRGRFSVGVVSIFALLLGLSSLGLNQAPRTILAQFPTSTPTAAPASPTPTATLVSPTLTATATSAPPGPTTPPPGPTTPAPGGQPTTQPAKPQGEPATPSTGIKVNRCARVVGPDGLNLGQGAGFGFGHVQIVGVNDVVFVTEGPQRGDGVWWWKVIARDGVTGWGINDHLMPHAGECFGGVAAPAVGAPPAVAAVTALPERAAAVSTTVSSSQEQLPATGGRDDGLLFAGALVMVVLVAGLIRRWTQRTA